MISYDNLFVIFLFLSLISTWSINGGIWSKIALAITVNGCMVWMWIAGFWIK